jgi:hypothetical protein
VDRGAAGKVAEKSFRANRCPTQEGIMRTAIRRLIGVGVIAAAAAVVLGSAGCGSSGGAAQGGSPDAGEAGNASVIFFNANVITLDPSQPIAQAIAVRNGLITLVGSNEA